MKKFPDMKDFPMSHKLGLLQPGSLVGEDDLFKKQPYSYSLRCVTKKGKIYKMSTEAFMKLKRN